MRGLSLVAASGGHSSLRCAGLSLSRPLPLRSTGSRRAGSVVVAHGPSCSPAGGIFPDQGSNPCPLHWQADSQPLRHQGSTVVFILELCVYLKLRCLAKGRCNIIVYWIALTLCQCTNFHTSANRRWENFWWSLRAISLGFSSSSSVLPHREHTISFPWIKPRLRAPIIYPCPPAHLHLHVTGPQGLLPPLPDVSPGSVTPISSHTYSLHLRTICNLLSPPGLQPSFKKSSPRMQPTQLPLFSGFILIFEAEPHNLALVTQSSLFPNRSASLPPPECPKFLNSRGCDFFLDPWRLRGCWQLQYDWCFRSSSRWKCRWTVCIVS